MISKFLEIVNTPHTANKLYEILNYKYEKIKHCVTYSKMRR
jgi:hypothetical protein